MAQAHADHHDPNVYFVPHSSKWPVFASVFLFVTMLGLASWLNQVSWGKATFFVGLAIALPLIGHATWHAYKDLVDPASG